MAYSAGTLLSILLMSIGWGVDTIYSQLAILNGLPEINEFLRNSSRVNPEADQTALGQLFTSYGFKSDGTYEGNVRAYESFYSKTAKDLIDAADNSNSSLIPNGTTYYEQMSYYLTAPLLKDMRLYSMLTYGATPKYILLGTTLDGETIYARSQAELEHKMADALIRKGYLGRGSTVHLLTETYNLIAQNSLKVSLWTIKVGNEWGCKLYLTPVDIEDVEMTKFAQQYFTAINELRITSLKDADGNNIVDYYTAADRTDASSSAQASVRMLNMGDVASLSFGTQYHITNGYTAAGTYIAIVPTSENRDVNNIDFDQVINDGYISPAIVPIHISSKPTPPIDSPIVVIDENKDPDSVIIVVNNETINNIFINPTDDDPIVNIYNNTNIVQYIYNNESTIQHPIADDKTPIDDSFENPIKQPDYPDTGETPKDGGTSDEEIPVVEAPNGFYTIYKVTGAQLREFRDYLWGNAANFEILKSFFSNPIDAVISCRAYTRGTVQAASESSNLRLGNVTTTALGHVVSNPSQRIYMGRIKIKPKFYSYLDYAPYTNVSVLLPFIANPVPLDTDTVMNSYLDLYYCIDYASGAAVAQIFCTKGGMKNVLIEQVPCQMFKEFPLTGLNFQSLARTLSQGITDALAQLADSATSPLQEDTAQGAVVKTLGGTLTEALSVKSQRVGNFSGDPGQFTPKHPIIIIERPIENIPNGLYQLQGQPCNQFKKVSDFTEGYVQFQTCDVSNIKGATKEELDQIKSILETGFYI